VRTHERRQRAGRGRSIRPAHGAALLTLVPLHPRSTRITLGSPTGATVVRSAGLPCLSVEERYESELARSESVLNAVDRSLQRLSDGTYGSCEVCAAPVGEHRLDVDPTQARCEQHPATETPDGE
jgi:hypothetical protein